MMKKKNDFTKNEQQFSDLLIKSVEEHTADPEPPHIDYSFLDEGGDKDIRVEVAAKRRLLKAVARVSVMLFVFFAGISLALITDVPGSASAWKMQFAIKLYELKEGFFSTDPNESKNYTYENKESILADSVEQIDRIKKEVPSLLELEYVPEGYLFDTLKIDRLYVGTYNATYEFRGAGSDYFAVNIYYNPESDYTSMDVDNVVEKIEREESNIYICQDMLEDSYGVILCSGHYVINVVGSIDSEEMVKVAENLK